MDDIVERLRKQAASYGVPKVSRISIVGNILHEAATEIEALRTLIANAKVEERSDTEYLCPQDGKWTSCPGFADDCLHDQTRTVIRTTLVWNCTDREHSNVLRRAWQSRVAARDLPRNHVYVEPPE